MTTKELEVEIAKLKKDIEELKARQPLVINYPTTAPCPLPHYPQQPWPYPNYPTIIC